MAEFEVTGMDELLQAFSEAPDKVLEQARAVTAKAALNIKKGMQADVQGLAHAPAFPASITYDTTQTRTGVSAEIGPDKDRPQGALGNLLYFGSAHNGAVADIMRPLNAEEPAYLEYLRKVVGDALA